MKAIWPVGLGALAFACFAIFGAQSEPKPSDQPQFTKDNQLIRPGDYREWIYLSSGLGMEYGASRGEPGRFTNVFVAPSAYRAFLTRSGRQRAEARSTSQAIIRRTSRASPPPSKTRNASPKAGHISLLHRTRARPKRSRNQCAGIVTTSTEQSRIRLFSSIRH